MPELSKRGYDDSMAIGTLAGSGTLGLLIPPSIILIIYGVAAEVSIARLFLAGALPGLILILLFMSYTIVWSIIKGRSGGAVDDITYTFAEKILALKKLIPIIFLIGGVLGSIYQGIATPTEAAAFGVLGALALSMLLGILPCPVL